MKNIVQSWADPTDQELTSDEAIDNWIIQRVKTFWHMTGTCKMGPESDPYAVVDQYGKVRGLKGLVVADMSIAPDIVRAPTHATAIMIGERISHWLQLEP
jgi:choline dehydrogenase-like flavoprotein